MLLVPTEATQVPLAARGIALSAIPLAVWIIRAHRGKLCPQPLIVLALLFASWLALSEALAPLHTRRGLEWLVIAAIALVAPIVATPRGLDPRQVPGALSDGDDRDRCIRSRRGTAPTERSLRLAVRSLELVAWPAAGWFLSNYDGARASARQRDPLRSSRHPCCK